MFEFKLKTERTERCNCSISDCGKISMKNIKSIQTSEDKNNLHANPLPSLLLVTGMLWTVRSLKQELVRTWSSTELKMHAWRSEKHAVNSHFSVVESLHKMKPTFFYKERDGQKQSSNDKSTFLLELLDAFPPL